MIDRKKLVKKLTPVAFANQAAAQTNSSSYPLQDWLHESIKTLKIHD